MSSSHLAFSSLEARVDAMQSLVPLDRISLRNHIVDVEIGAFQVERDLTQRVSFNIVVELTPVAKDLSDDVDKILSYDTLIEAVQIELAAERLNLLETLAERIADRVLIEPRSVRVFVRIEKLDRGPGALGVEIVRTVADQSQAVDATAGDVQPLVVYLSALAQSTDQLAEWLDGFAQVGGPVVLCVEPPVELPGGNKAPQVQRRIELLGSEQAAWALAARDDRCAVRASRTELDWAVKQGLISVWAPSKMVFDAVDVPQGDALSLAAWLAIELNARELIVLGEDLPEGCNIPMRTLDLKSPIPLL